MVIQGDIITGLSIVLYPIILRYCKCYSGHVPAEVQKSSIPRLPEREPLRRFALGAFPFQIFEPPRNRAKAQAVKKPLALFSPCPQNFLKIFQIP